MFKISEKPGSVLNRFNELKYGFSVALLCIMYVERLAFLSTKFRGREEKIALLINQFPKND